MHLNSFEIILRLHWLSIFCHHFVHGTNVSIGAVDTRYCRDPINSASSKYNKIVIRVPQLFRMTDSIEKCSDKKVREGYREQITQVEYGNDKHQRLAYNHIPILDILVHKCYIII